jgi:hypothetical protein
MGDIEMTTTRKICPNCHELNYASADVCPNCGLGDVKRRPNRGANMPMPRTAPREFYEKQMRDYLAWHKRFYRKSE